MIRLCGARAKRTGKPCQRIACKNGRCHLHGGKSTGPRTAEGRQRCKMAPWKHGQRSREAREEKKRVSEFLKEMANDLDNWESS